MEKLVKMFLEEAQRQQLSTFEMEKAIIAILGIMVTYRAQPGQERNYLDALSVAALEMTPFP